MQGGPKPGPGRARVGAVDSTGRFGIRSAGHLAHGQYGKLALVRVSWPSSGLMLIRFDLDRGRERGGEREFDGQLAQSRVDAD